MREVKKGKVNFKVAQHISMINAEMAVRKKPNTPYVAWK